MAFSVRRWTIIFFAVRVVVALTHASTAHAQHADIAVFQDATGKITTHSSTAGLPVTRVFSRAFDFFGHPFGNPGLPKAFIGDDPGFQMSGSSAPAGFSSLPGQTILEIDFLPMQLPTVGKGNFFHWAAEDDLVSFGAVPNAHTLVIEDATGNDAFILDGSDSSVAGALAGITDSGGGMHEHLQFRLDDNDGNETTEPATGMYLFNVQLKMPGRIPSDPFLVTLWSPEVPSVARTAGLAWLQSNLEELTSSGLPGDFDSDGSYTTNDIDLLVEAVAAGSTDLSFDLTDDATLTLADVDAWRSLAGAILNDSGGPILPGDTNLDGTVDGADFLSWNRDKFSATAAWSRGDFTADGQIDGADFLIWNTNKFQSADTTVVPEPTTQVLGILALAFLTRVRSARPR